MAYGIFHRRIVLPEIEYSEEEIDIIYHRPDTDFSLNILSYTQQKYHEQMKELIEKDEKEHSLNNQDIDK